MAGIYIHIPFCKSRCKYCDFFSTTQLEKQSQYVEALLAEWQDRKSELAEEIQTIYIGGGTPSTLDRSELLKLVQVFSELHPQEFTLEANPGDITEEKVRAWREMGINRLSIGVQSFDDGLLQLIGRRHTAEQARQAVAIAQAAGFDNISIDLMYALPSQTMEQWQQDVQAALQLGIQHISTYGLIYEEGTALTEMLERGDIVAVDEELEIQMYDYLVDQLTANGFVHYEVSNFALEGYASKHNSSYWNNTPYIGLGAGAHSYDGQVRSWNISDLDQYIEHALAHNLRPEKEVLTDEDKHIERIMLGLRTDKGVSKNEIDITKAEAYIQQGMLVEQDNRLIATTKGYHILNRIIGDLIDMKTEKETTKEPNQPTTPPTSPKKPRRKKVRTAASKKFMIIFASCFWGIIVIGLLTIYMLFHKISNGDVHIGGFKLPEKEKLQNPKNKMAAEMFTSDMQPMGRFYSENRVEVTYDSISPYLIDALIATEDVRFYDHTGIDFKSLFRAVVFLGKAGGGSTITQQLAKQMWTPNTNSPFVRAMQKPLEWVVATKLERLFSKEEILTMYLNKFDFLNQAKGIKSAAKIYFNTTPKNLKIEEAAMLVGMCKNPAIYNPRTKPKAALQRRNTVLNQMCKYKYITQAQCDSLKALPIQLKYTPIDHKLGLAPYFREYLRLMLTAKKPDPNSDKYKWNKLQYQIDKRQWDENPLYGWCNKNRKPDGTPYDLYTDGLRIFTTIDSRMQLYAEEAVREHMQELQKEFFNEKKKKSYAPFSKDLTTSEINTILERAMKQTDRYWVLKHEKELGDAEIRKIFDTPVKMRIFTYDGMKDTTMSPMDSIRWNKHFLRCGFMSMDPHSGAVKAYVGGPNFTNFQYDMVTTGRRQVGSTFKPYLYTLAMDEGMWPCDSVINEPVTLIDGNGIEWTPRDDHDENLGETVTLTWGLMKSSNWITAYLMSLFPPERLVDMLRSFGVEGQLDPVVSLCLGPCELSVEEMVEAYTTFPNKGTRVEPLYVTRIEDHKGNVLATFKPKNYEVISEETSYKMLHMLQSVMDAGGTGYRVRFRYGLKAPIGGKTGTTQNNSDGWFVGFTPSLVSGVWVGGEDRAIHFDKMSLGQGANTSLPIWALYMKKVYADKELGYSESEEFNIPESFDPGAGCQ